MSELLAIILTTIIIWHWYTFLAIKGSWWIKAISIIQTLVYCLILVEYIRIPQDSNQPTEAFLGLLLSSAPLLICIRAVRWYYFNFYPVEIGTNLIRTPKGWRYLIPQSMGSLTDKKVLDIFRKIYHFNERNTFLCIAVPGVFIYLIALTAFQIIQPEKWPDTVQLMAFLSPFLGFIILGIPLKIKQGRLEKKYGISMKAIQMKDEQSHPLKPTL